MNDKVCVCSIALNEYKNSEAIQSHRDYCKRHKYNYALMEQTTRPSFNFNEISWSRFHMILNLFENFDWVVWVSADAVINEIAPEIPKNSHLQLVKDSSGSFNFGFGIYKNSDIGKIFIKDIIANKKYIYDYENYEYRLDKIFNYVDHNYGILELPKAWNNTFNLETKDYIRHYSRELKEYRIDQLKLYPDLNV
jgi:hypothetical protein